MQVVAQVTSSRFGRAYTDEETLIRMTNHQTEILRVVEQQVEETSMSAIDIERSLAAAVADVLHRLLPATRLREQVVEEPGIVISIVRQDRRFIIERTSGRVYVPDDIVRLLVPDLRALASGTPLLDLPDRQWPPVEWEPSERSAANLAEQLFAKRRG